jgi:uncharacterized protein
MSSLFNRLKDHAAFPFVAPFVLFMLFLILESLHSSMVYLVYPIKTVAVGFLILFLWYRLPSLNLNRPLLSITVGIGVFILWIKLGPLITWGEPQGGFQPFSFQEKEIAWGLALMRLLGASLVVPIMEELFWRGYLMRWLIQDKFEDIALGTYRPFSFFATTILFASIHGSFAPVALVTGLIYGFFFIKTKSLGNVILAHGITNLCLGVYVLITKQWFFW